MLRYQQASQIKTDVEVISRRADKQAAEPARGRVRRAWRRLASKLDPRTSDRKRIGNVEVPATWPLGVVLFLIAGVIAFATQSQLVAFAVFVCAAWGIYWVIKHAA